MGSLGARPGLERKIAGGLRLRRDVRGRLPCRVRGVEIAAELLQERERLAALPRVAVPRRPHNL